MSIRKRKTNGKRNKWESSRDARIPKKAPPTKCIERKWKHIAMSFRSHSLRTHSDTAYCHIWDIFGTYANWADVWLWKMQLRNSNGRSEVVGITKEKQRNKRISTRFSLAANVRRLNCGRFELILKSKQTIKHPTKEWTHAYLSLSTKLGQLVSNYHSISTVYCHFVLSNLSSKTQKTSEWTSEKGSVKQK